MVIGLIAWIVLALALPLAALTLNVARIAGFPLGYWIGAQGSLIGLAILALVFSRRARAESTGEGMRPALVYGVEALGALAVIGAAGALVTLGYDGLSLAIGLVAGMALMTIIVAPRFVLYPAQSIGGFFAARYGSAWARRLALTVLVSAAVFLLAAEIRGGALAMQALLPAGYGVAIAAVVVVIILAALVRSVIAPRRSAGLAYLTLFGALMAALAGIATNNGDLAVPHATFGGALEALANLDQRLVTGKLADVASLRPMTSPFLQLSMLNFVGLLLAVALGIAAAPHLIGRHLSRAAVSPGDAVARAGRATLLVAIVVACVAPLAVHTKLGFGNRIAVGIEIAAIPPEIVQANRVGGVGVCGRHGEAAGELSGACAKMPGQRGFLRLQDLTYQGDGFMVSAPLLAGVSHWAAYALYAGLLLATLVTAHALLAGVLGADAEARSRGSVDPAAMDPRSVVVGLTLIVAAALLAGLSGLDLASLAGDGLALIASGLFPALVLSLYWRRMTAAGAVAGIAAGFALAFIYIVGVHFFPLQLVSWTGGLSSATPSQLQKLDALSAAIARAADPIARDALQAALMRQASLSANWFGLKPPAIVLIAAPVSFATAAIASLVTPSSAAQNTR